MNTLGNNSSCGYIKLRINTIQVPQKLTAHSIPEYYHITEQ